MKKSLSVLLAVILFMSISSIPATALNSPVEITPFYLNISMIDMAVTFSGTLANCEVQVHGGSGTTSITSSISLDRVNSNGTLTNIDKWSHTSSTTLAVWTGSRYVSSGYTYRLTLTTTVIRNGVSETVTRSCDAYLK